MEKIRVALVHDWLTGQRGGEKVLEVLAEIFPEAPIYTLFHFPGSQSPALEGREIHTSFLQRLPCLRKKYRMYLPLFPLAVELFDLSDYDLVVSSSHCVAKGIIPGPDALHLSYVHSPVRYAWNQYHAYFSPRELSLFRRLAVPRVIHRLRIWDVASSARVDHFIANSANVARRIRRYYRRDAEVIHPPVDTDFFQPAARPSRDYFLLVTALVPYKNAGLVVETFRQTGDRLVVVGRGMEQKALRRLAGADTQWLPAVSGERLRELYQNARALVFAGVEDFGIALAESQACATPVIAFGRGGARDIVVDRVTGVLFPEATVPGLKAALADFARLDLDAAAIRANSLRFSAARFREEFQRSLRSLAAERK